MKFRQIKTSYYLKMHVGDEGVVQLRVLIEGLVAGEHHLQQLLPTLEGVVVVSHQEANERKLQLSQNFVQTEMDKNIFVHVLVQV